MIYFIQAGVGGPIKIGVTGNLPKRIASMAINNPHALCVLGSVAGDQPLEQAIHRYLWRDRVRGEWFHPNERVLRLISEALAGRLIAHLADGEKARSEHLSTLDQEARDFSNQVGSVIAALIAAHGLTVVANKSGVKPAIVRKFAKTCNGPITAFAAIFSAYAVEVRDNRATLEDARDAIEELLSKLVRAA